MRLVWSQPKHRKVSWKTIRQKRHKELDMKSFYAYGWIVFATNKVAGSPQVKGIFATEESAENEKKVLEANTGGVYFSVSRVTINQPEKLNVQPLA